ncbi:tRNA (adenosine(37)-N6)-threonylcarbamoyltransferase complex dimerization subunit type 1 TsaB [Roseomonas sp. SSH11]|uniref:tRNA (Adenosine(37)-N6)-threonylcarbamoyltransferase complex dimerization subunit type 1 TsaB n=1 Tax=Pararoseomonas baculiformis TaxID=2820812 RepID=A0ABS4ABB4_9PROT|nr:tRNA (adenosine(37)-N6)-threonylcarbamoyltransferase complex dimerization subunit type 1 TsaB [Pararoseomonas baculiformis]MBP0444289.1 tRNA (adenosine(37)-N6)-threonylcarbamoyltransferase complex dimerization subunit type 1 TsaB [Pararoseomonas baculiformis]
MRLLGLDAALARASAALWQDGALLAEARQDGARGQPAVLPALADSVLRQGHGRPDAVAVTVGPGGFTGIRAAIALGRGLADGWGVPLLGVTTGEALAEALPPWQREGREVWSVTFAGRGGLVLERRDYPAMMVEEPSLPMPDGPVVLVGDAAPQAAARLRAGGADALLSDARLPAAGVVAALAARHLSAGTGGREAAPLYAEPLALRFPGAA